MTDDRKYIYVKGEKIYVSDEIYKAYKKQVNHDIKCQVLMYKKSYIKMYNYSDLVI